MAAINLEDSLRAEKRPANEETAYSKAANAFKEVEDVKVGHLAQISQSTKEMSALLLRHVVAMERIAAAKEGKLALLREQHCKGN